MPEMPDFMKRILPPCPKCGHLSSPNDRFCRECGAVRTLPKTVKVLEVQLSMDEALGCNHDALRNIDYRFCNRCGKRL